VKTWLTMALATVAAFAGATVLVLASTDRGACACSPAPGRPPAGALGPGPVTIEVPIEHSAFEAEDITVVAGTEVRFVLANHDPIGHELIVGPPEVHTRHEGGHEASHPPRPGEVSVGPNTTAETTYAFDRPGEVEYACHLPGHYDYGMHGTITVVAA
jgi:plastocyanin